MKDNVIPAAIRGRKDKDGRYRQTIQPHNPAFSNTLTTVQKDNVLITGRLCAELTRPVSHCIEASYGAGVWMRERTGLPRRQAVLAGSRIRRLTPRECWRLMGFTDADYDKARAALNRRFYNGRNRADSQMYKQAGNSIVVNVLFAILRELENAMPYLFRNVSVGSFFSGIGAFEKALSSLPGPPG